MNEPIELSQSECRELLDGGVFGRVALCTPEGPRIFPVNYSIVEESVVFRTSPFGTIGTHDWRSSIAFEVDHVDYSDHRGWSVLATGPGRRVEDPDELAEIKESWDPRPWAGGSRPLYVRLAWTGLSGRRLGRSWTEGADERPVRRTVR